MGAQRRWREQTPASYLVMAALAGACGPDGTGRVDANFFRSECPPGMNNDDLDNYGWDAGGLTTDRFEAALTVNITEFNVDILETDGVGIRLDLVALSEAQLLPVRGDFFELTGPLTVAIGPNRDQAQVILSLYQTCPRLPGYSAVSGNVRLERLKIRRDGEDTGRDEVLAGQVLDAVLSYAQAPSPVGLLEVSFDFEPPVNSLREFE